jgi:soluble lytic murein transglycosylase-like protein
MSNSAKANKRKYSAYIAASARKYNVDERLVHAVILAESAYNPNARSPVGAVGLMQLMPATARRFGVTNRRDPRQSIDGGTHYLKILLKMFNNSKRLAVAGYNAGEGAVIKYKRTVPPYRETQNYVKKVLASYYRS